MKKDAKTPGRPLYSFFETYQIEVNALRMSPIFRKSIQNKLLDEQFKERIMLAVTNVNGCPMCSYAHTKYALESGMSDEEIQSFLGAGSQSSDNYIPTQETVGVSFAEHYADTRTKPEQQAWDAVLNRYGQDKALAILSAIRIITMGNAFGVRLGGVIDRFRKQPYDHRTNPITSIIFLLLALIATPIAIIQALFMNLFHIRLTNFK